MIKKTRETLPLEGVRILEFSHVVMGPACGLILADMGAEVIKIEPPNEGDKTRYSSSFGAGFFRTYNRNKKSISIDIKSTEGKAIVKDLVKSTDVMIENFRSGTMEKQGLGYKDLVEINPKIIYCSLKGFLSGPYENRVALDEVVQMMGGLAYMTGPPGQPSRAGASINDIMGGMFGVIGILCALLERRTSGVGSHVKAGLFENCALLVAQHIAYFERTGKPNKTQFIKEDQPWSVYDLFDVKHGEKIFIALVTDGQWNNFCQEFKLQELRDHPDLQNNTDRVAHRNYFLPLIRKLIAQFDLDNIIARLEQVECPFSPVSKPEDLLKDIHLNQSQGFLDVEITPGQAGKLPGLPLEYNHRRFPLRIQPPLIGEHTREILLSLGRTNHDIDKLIDEGMLTETVRS